MCLVYSQWLLVVTGKSNNIFLTNAYTFCEMTEGGAMADEGRAEPERLPTEVEPVEMET